MDQNKFKVAYVITERNDKTYWNRIGVAFTNKDGSLNVKLDAFPTNGTLHIRDYEPREEFDSDAPSLAQATRTSAHAVSEQAV